MGTARTVRVTCWGRALSAALAAGLVVLTAGLFGAWWLASSAGAPGPGTAMLLGHLVAAGAAVTLLRLARLRPDLVGLAALVGVPVVMTLVGIVFWWGW